MSSPNHDMKYATCAIAASALCGKSAFVSKSSLIGKLDRA